jgi:hypothetical protein
MYSKLLDEGNRLAAFAEAQARTRQILPEYRDWGAFVYFGT